MAFEERAEVAHLMGYADSAGEEEDCAVGGEGGGVAVGTFDESSGCEASILHFEECVGEASGEAFAAADYCCHGWFGV